MRQPSSIFLQVLMTRCDGAEPMPSLEDTPFLYLKNRPNGKRKKNIITQGRTMTAFVTHFTVRSASVVNFDGQEFCYWFSVNDASNIQHAWVANEVWMISIFFIYIYIYFASLCDSLLGRLVGPRQPRSQFRLGIEYLNGNWWLHDVDEIRRLSQLEIHLRFEGFCIYFPFFSKGGSKCWRRCRLWSTRRSSSFFGSSS